MKQNSTKNININPAEQVSVHLRMRPLNEKELESEKTIQIIETFDTAKKLVIGK